MSMPPSRSRIATWSEQTSTTIPPVTGPLTTHNTTVRSVESSSSAKKKTPYQYVGRAWSYKGRMYYRGNWVRPDKTPYKAPSIRRGKWRDPLPYSCNLVAGDVDSFKGQTEFKYNVNGVTTVTESGELLCGRNNLTIIPLPGFDATVAARAEIKALLKLKNQKINLGVAFAERAETSRLLIQTLGGLTKAASSLARGDMGGVARGLGLKGTPKEPKNRNFPQKWLEMQYGWEPLYGDVFGAVKALHDADMDDQKRYCTSVKGGVSMPYDRGYDSTVSYCKHTTRRFKGAEKALCRLDFFLENPFLQSLVALGITNPALVAWERIPFSFVADWFVPIGSYLGALDATLGWRFRAGSLSKLIKEDEWYSVSGVAEGVRYPGHTYGVGRRRQLKLVRTIYNSPPFPQWPGFKNPFPDDGKHIANAIALYAAALHH